MSKEKLIVRFHNPNTQADTARYIARIFINASKVKFEQLIKKTAGPQKEIV